jgi:hypothetical protein
MECAKDEVKQVSREAAVIGALAAFAALTGAAAFGVGLIGLYRWTAAAYGPNTALATVGSLLVAVTAVLTTAALIRGKSLTSNGIKSLELTEAACDTRGGVSEKADNSDAAASGQTPTSASASDLVAPLAFFLSRVLRYPTFGNPVANECIGKVRAIESGTVEDVISRAANVIRYGNRTHFVIVLAGCTLAGWLVTHDVLNNKRTGPLNLNEA